MTLSDRIKTYCTHGGDWRYLQKTLIKSGLSERFSSDFTCFAQSMLGETHARIAVEIFESCKNGKSERHVRAKLRLRGIVPF